MRLARRFILAGVLALTPLLAPVGASAEQKSLRVGIMSAEDEDVWAVVAEQAKQKGLDVKLVVFNDYTQPNEALENGELDANAFQHKPYLKELDAGIVGRSIDDLDAAVVNTDWALKSGLTPGDRIATEAVDNNPYRNFIAVKAGHENDAWVKPLVESYENDTVRSTLAKVYKGTALPAW